ncbi:YraN family protein [Sphingobacterium sp. CZ-2]|uniref:YraN family protein n=1 Tax=Sphingobacterium sp. CZ-2 TaxID=2557994 RepID=UPI00106FCA68|nr:YraN family protein [Sphingobacterium sp. CZ-2]QBR13580.1 hypothetical protein E3D81_15900 [Sphingobacterium sp. CZ-2]
MSDLGKRGEEMAWLFLERKGLKVLETNWRFKHLELDLIGMDGKVLVFVGVKLLGKREFVEIHKILSKEKKQRLSRAALHTYNYPALKGKSVLIWSHLSRIK